MKNALQNYQNNQQPDQDSARHALIRSYGRIKSRRLSDHKNFLLENLLSEYEIVAEDFIDINLIQQNQGAQHVLQNKILAKNSIKNNFEKISFEIGFGFGDFLFAKAQSTPNQMFLGCEPHINGVVNVLAKLEKEALNNIKISRIDAREMLQKFPDNFFDEIYILFPDPWPKAKHFKRRLLNLEFLDFIATKLKKQGKLIIATDHDSYKTWILSAILKCNSLKWQASSKQDWQVFPDNWIETKYQKKAAVEGRVSVIFNLKKAN